VRFILGILRPTCIIRYLRCITWELPNHIPFEATKVLILQYTNFWSTPALKCFDLVVDRLGGNLEDLLERHFGCYFHLKKYLTYAEIRSNCFQFNFKTRNATFEERDRCRGEAISTLRKVLDLETNPVFTQNFDFLNEQERYWSSHYTVERRKLLLEEERRIEEELRRMQEEQAALQAQTPQYFDSELPASPPRPDFSQVSSPIAVSRPISEPSFPQHTFPKYRYDPAIDGGETTWTVDEEIKVMANVQAYFQVAHKASIQ